MATDSQRLPTAPTDSPTGQAARAVWSQRLALAAVLLLAAGLRFYHLNGSSLWSDEGNSWAMLGRSFGEIAAAAANDIHPPGYYWLLKLWSIPFGIGAWAMRSLSAVAGVLLVWVIYRLAWRAAPDAWARRWWTLLAALLAAINPFQVYYSQEARMYLLLALLGAGMLWALVEWLAADHPERAWLPQLGYVLCAAAGLWVHYSYPILLAVAGLAFLGWWLRHRRGFVRFVLLNLAAVVLFLPWLPTALRSVLAWPKGGVPVAWAEGAVLTLRTLLFGPQRHVLEPLWPWLAVGIVLPLIGLFMLRRGWVALLIGLWLLLPIALMAGLGLFTPAFLKFLLVASPAWCLATAAVVVAEEPHAPQRLPGWSIVLGNAAALFGIALALVTLPRYYSDPMVRDNYRGVADYLRAAGDPAHDLVVLDAPGQAEVWRYYDPGLPTLSLPTSRPAVAADVETQLAQAVAGKRRIYALFWAADEADPQRLVEGWLDRNTYKALDAWQGNLRLAAYATAGDLQPVTLPPQNFGNGIVLAGQAQPAGAQGQVTRPGDVALVQLRWQPTAAIAQDYQVSVQLLDGRNQVVAQRDSAPVGGSRPTSTWRAGEQIEDNYALPIPFGTPPGSYRLVATVYDPATGERLRLADGSDAIDLGSVTVERAAQPAPPEIVPMQMRLNQALGPVVLAGYDAYKQGFAHAPDTPIAPGDTVHFTLYWQAPQPLPADWPADAQFTLRVGDQATTAPLAGGGYPTAQWQPGELVRGEFDVVYGGGDQAATLSLDGVEVRLPF